MRALSICILAMAATVEAAQSRAPGPVMPNPMLTPGVVRELSLEEICTTRWGLDRRFVTPAMRREVFTRYRLRGPNDPACRKDKHGRRYELDHLIPRQLGGADDVDNLFPQCYAGRPWNAVLKDRVENRLHKEVCAGTITLEDAQRDIAKDWRALYRKFFGEPPR
jgi:hypothetical protein